MSTVFARHYPALQASVDRFWDVTKRRQDDRDAADAALEQRIAAEVGRMAGRASDDPAYCARIVNEAEIGLHELRVKLHGESMTWERAVFEVLHMASRLDDPPRFADAPLPAKKGPRRMEAGPFMGYVIRRARKAGRCDYWRGALGRCANRIEVGDEYVEGELNDYGRAGGFGRDRWCMACATRDDE